MRYYEVCPGDTGVMEDDCVGISDGISVWPDIPRDRETLSHILDSRDNL